VGSVGVGKTSTVMRFIKDSFKENLETTVGYVFVLLRFFADLD